MTPPLIHVKAAPGRRVRDWRDGSILPEHGKEGEPPLGKPVSPQDLFWFRRLRDGDCVEVDEAGALMTAGTLMQQHGITVPALAAAAAAPQAPAPASANDAAPKPSVKPKADS